MKLNLAISKYENEREPKFNMRGDLKFAAVDSVIQQMFSLVVKKELRAAIPRSQIDFVLSSHLIRLVKLVL